MVHQDPSFPFAGFDALYTVKNTTAQTYITKNVTPLPLPARQLVRSCHFLIQISRSSVNTTETTQILGFTPGSDIDCGALFAFQNSMSDLNTCHLSNQRTPKRRRLVLRPLP